MGADGESVETDALTPASKDLFISLKNYYCCCYYLVENETV